LTGSFRSTADDQKTKIRLLSVAVFKQFQVAVFVLMGVFVLHGNMNSKEENIFLIFNNLPKILLVILKSIFQL